MLGTWQDIVFLELDNRPRQRKLIVQIMGEGADSLSRVRRLSDDVSDESFR